MTSCIFKLKLTPYQICKQLFSHIASTDKGYFYLHQKMLSNFSIARANSTKWNKKQILNPK